MTTDPAVSRSPSAEMRATLGPDPNSLPLEVFEAIIGAISFVDLPHFLQTSKAIYVSPPLPPHSHGKGAKGRTGSCEHDIIFNLNHLQKTTQKNYMPY